MKLSPKTAEIGSCILYLIYVNARGRPSVLSYSVHTYNTRSSTDCSYLLQHVNCKWSPKHATLLLIKDSTELSRSQHIRPPTCTFNRLNHKRRARSKIPPTHSNVRYPRSLLELHTHFEPRCIRPSRRLGCPTSSWKSAGSSRWHSIHDQRLNEVQRHDVQFRFTSTRTPGRE